MVNLKSPIATSLTSTSPAAAPYNKTTSFAGAVGKTCVAPLQSSFSHSAAALPRMKRSLPPPSFSDRWVNCMRQTPSLIASNLVGLGALSVGVALGQWGMAALFGSVYVATNIVGTRTLCNDEEWDAQKPLLAVNQAWNHVFQTVEIPDSIQAKPSLEARMNRIFEANFDELLEVKRLLLVLDSRDPIFLLGMRNLALLALTIPRPSLATEMAAPLFLHIAKQTKYYPDLAAAILETILNPRFQDGLTHQERLPWTEIFQPPQDTDQPQKAKQFLASIENQKQSSLEQTLARKIYDDLGQKDLQALLKTNDPFSPIFQEILQPPEDQQQTAEELLVSLMASGETVEIELDN